MESEVTVDTYIDLAYAFSNADTVDLKPVYAPPFSVESCTGFSLLFFNSCIITVLLRGTIYVKPYDESFEDMTPFSLNRRTESYIDDFIYSWLAYVPESLGHRNYSKPKFREVVAEARVLRDILKG